MLLFPGKVRTKETTCCRITYLRVKITIDKNFTIKHDTSVFYGNKHICYMTRSEEAKVVLEGWGCTSVHKLVWCALFASKLKPLFRIRRGDTLFLNKSYRMERPTEPSDGELLKSFKAKLRHPVWLWQGCEDKGEEFNDISKLVLF